MRRKVIIYLTKKDCGKDEENINSKPTVFLLAV